MCGVKWCCGTNWFSDGRWLLSHRSSCRYSMRRRVRCEKRIWQQAGDLCLMYTHAVGTEPRGDRGREVVQAPFLNELFV